ncbi:hypothetical protein [Actomonas aquatica]|uniref:Uncharacterized protein n=1 Tax=Actomonas aquatica TaxID=2866162 RepID=A0ABZ1C709_9BACT|nr:hypothetical protein [Opitutus sp. WL0086]WRQ87241.1 hypothetical protein K1X11_020705 [Opitutus sp. WL0086]
MFELKSKKKASPLLVKVISLGLGIGILSALVGGVFFRDRMEESDENRAITEIITAHIAPTESWTVVATRLIPERSERGRYLSGEFQGQRNGDFVYEVSLKDQPYPLILKVTWRWDTDLGIDQLVVVNYRAGF